MKAWTLTRTALLLLAFAQLTNGFTLKDAIKEHLTEKVSKGNIRDRPKIVKRQTEKK